MNKNKQSWLQFLSPVPVLRNHLKYTWIHVQCDTGIWSVLYKGNERFSKCNDTFFGLTTSFSINLINRERERERGMGARPWFMVKLVNDCSEYVWFPWRPENITFLTWSCPLPDQSPVSTAQYASERQREQLLSTHCRKRGNGSLHSAQTVCFL